MWWTQWGGGADVWEKWGQLEGEKVWKNKAKASVRLPNIWIYALGHRNDASLHLSVHPQEKDGNSNGVKSVPLVLAMSSDLLQRKESYCINMFLKPLF